MKVLITGITGMIGSHFANAYKLKGDEVYGIARSSAASRMMGGEEPHIFRCDILDRDALVSVFSKIKPDIVIHMAAQSFNGASWKMESITHETNYLGTLNVLKATKEIVPNAKVLLACSSAEYGVFDEEDCPLDEERLLRPVTPYGVSKVATECLGFQYFSNYQMQVFLPRLFIHVGTGHPPATAIQNFARQLALIKKKKAPSVIKVGNLETARDFIDVRDGVEAMIRLIEKGAAGDPTNICTGKAYKISEILEMLIEISGLKVQIEIDEALFRVSDEKLLLGDNTKIKKLGWKRNYSIKETLESVYQDWLKRIEI